MESLHKHPLVTKLVLVNSTSIAEKFDPNLPFLVVLTSDKITTVKRKKQHKFDWSFSCPISRTANITMIALVLLDIFVTKWDIVTN